MSRSLPLTPATSLERALAAASPRLSPPPTPAASLAIHGAAAALFAAACLGAVLARGLLAWAPGLVYVAYDLLLVTIVLMATRRPDTIVRGAEAPRLTLAVVVAARDEARALPRTLHALLNQADPPELIVIADDGSSDDTAALLARDLGLAPVPLGGVSRSPTHPSLRWLRLPHGGKARALNAALLATETDIVLTVDADTLADAGAVGAFRAAFAADPHLVAAGGRLVPTCDATRLGRLLQAFQRQEYTRDTLFFGAWARLNALLHIPGAFAGFRREALIAVGGFDPACLVEDYELIHRLRRHGALYGLGWTTGMAAARATTDAPATLATFLRQRRRWFCGFLETQLWYRGMVGDPRYGRVGRMMLPIKAFDTLQPLHGLLALALLPVLALRGYWGVLAIAAALLAVKIGLDLHVARRCRHAEDGDSSLGAALGTALLGLLSFEILRHLGAALGWVAILTGVRAWRAQPRDALVAARDTDAAWSAPGTIRRRHNFPPSTRERTSMPKPHVICHMASSVDGRIKIKRWSKLDVDGTVEKAYEAVHDKLDGDAWICGRITMAGYAPGEPPKPYSGPPIPREDHIAEHDARSRPEGYAIGLDAHARMHWGERNDITGDHVVMILTEQASDAHLDALRRAGVSYLFGGRDTIDLGRMLEKLTATFSIKRLLLEGGGRINGAFLAAGLVDEVSLLVAPAVDGLIGTPAVFDYEGHADAPKSMALTLRSVEPMEGGVVWLRYDVERG